MKPDIVRLDKNAPYPAFDITLGTQTLRNFGVILNFAESIITIDPRDALMRPLDAFSSLSTRKYVLRRENHNTHHSTMFPGAPPDPVAVQEATGRTMGILDASYEKADLPKVIRNSK